MTATKTFPAVVKSLDDQTGTFEALVSVFGNVDLVGDRVMPGAFSKSLGAWRASGDPIPVTWSHDWSLDGFIGSADPNDVVETEKGLVVKGRLNLDDAGGRKAHALLKARLVKNFSFSYEVPEGGEQRAKDGANELLALELIEVGPTLVGANRATELLGVKTAELVLPLSELGLKAGRVFSTANEATLQAIGEQVEVAGDLLDGISAQIEALLAQIDPAAEATEEADEGKAEDPATGKAEDPIDPASFRNSSLMQEAQALLS